MAIDLSSLKQIVQTNCHIADSRAAGNYTLCIYLLKMREFYRWESGYDYGDALPRDEVGSWLREREQLWETLEEQTFLSIPIDGTEFDPFDAASINAILRPQRLIYSGGLGGRSHAHFFLGVLERYEQHNDFEIIVVADEYARDLTAPPAMSQGRTIYIRREAMRRMIWEKYEQWLWNRPDNAFKKALDYYDFDNDLDGSLTRMTSAELNAAVLHEIGEVRAHEILGEDWEALLHSLPHSKLELMLRAIRDHLADALSTLPALLNTDDDASLHFYIANLTHMRKDLFPGLLMAYEAWTATGKRDALHTITHQAATHWQTLCLTVLSLWQQDHEIDNQRLIDIIEQNRL